MKACCIKLGGNSVIFIFEGVEIALLNYLQWFKESTKDEHTGLKQYWYGIGQCFWCFS